MTDYSDLPYRPCAGIMLVNRAGKVFTGQRLDNPGSDAWQMPQGGIDEGESAEACALRELEEETGISRDLVTVISQTHEELFYDLPDTLLGKIWGGKWRGQRQIWFLMRFNGEDSDIDIGTDHAEFSRWEWADVAQLTERIVPFKKRLYETVIAEFSELI